MHIRKIQLWEKFPVIMFFLHIKYALLAIWLNYNNK